MKKAFLMLIGVLAVIVLLPVLFGIIAGGYIESDRDSDLTAVCFILAVLQSATIWWLIYKVFM